jgi:hypothetical protein
MSEDFIEKRVRNIEIISLFKNDVITYLLPRDAHEISSLSSRIFLESFSKPKISE